MELPRQGNSVLENKRIKAWKFEKDKTLSDAIDNSCKMKISLLNSQRSSI